MKILLCIKCRTIAALLLWLLALAPAIAQTVVHKGDTTRLEVEQIPYDTYTWELYNDSTVNFAVIPGTAVTDGDAEFVNGNIGPTVNVLWNEPGLYFTKVTARDAAGCTTNVKVRIFEVLDVVPTATILAHNPICVGAKTDIHGTLTGTGPWSFIYTDGTTSWTETNVMTNNYVVIIDPGPIITTQYWITSVTDRYGTNMEPTEKTIQIVNPVPTPSNIYHN